MSNKWLDVLKEEVSKHNTAAALREAVPARPNGPGQKGETRGNRTAKTAKTLNQRETEAKNPQTSEMQTAKTAKTLEDAGRLGLVASWSGEFGFVSVHDPTTGDWWDIQTGIAPEWAVREARKRKELYKDGNRRAYRLTAREMERILDKERTPDQEGIIEEHPVEEEV